MSAAHSTTQTPQFIRYLKAGLLAGIASAIVNNILYALLVVLGGHTWQPVVAVSVLVASFLPSLLASVVYFVLKRVIPTYARIILTVAVVAFVLISILPHLGIGAAPSEALSLLPAGFDIVTVPLHIVFGLAATVLMPWLAARD